MGDQGSSYITGSRFKPTQQELLWLIRYKVRGNKISTVTDSVIEKTLYGGEGTEPWHVLSDVDDNKWELYDESSAKDSRRVLYVLTKVSSMSEKKRSRTAGCGTWEGQNQKKVMNYDGDKVEGFMRTLNYVVDKSVGVGKGSSWYMHEYALSDNSLKELGVFNTDYVICRVIRKDDTKHYNMNSSKEELCGLKRKNKCTDNNVGEYHAQALVEEQHENHDEFTATFESSYAPAINHDQFQYGSAGELMSQHFYGTATSESSYAPVMNHDQFQYGSAGELMSQHFYGTVTSESSYAPVMNHDQFKCGSVGESMSQHFYGTTTPQSSHGDYQFNTSDYPMESNNSQMVTSNYPVETIQQPTLMHCQSATNGSSFSQIYNGCSVNVLNNLGPGNNLTELDQLLKDNDDLTHHTLRPIQVKNDSFAFCTS